MRSIPPEFSAATTFTPRQLAGLIGSAVVLVAAIAVFPRQTAGVAVIASTVLFTVLAVDRVVLLISGMRRRSALVISDDEARAIADDDLPPYTILLPAYGEPEIVTQLLAGIGRLDYPRHKLQVLLVLEADDDATVSAAHAGGLGDLATVVLVPPSEPRTKPKACNVALESEPILGEFVTIYDAEDIPEPLQLRRVVAAFREADDDLACIQCRLGYFNERQNLLTRWFSIEYDHWFAYILPELGRRRCPLPLGGTSNHIRTDVLRSLGGWDPHNVTEDADLGIRLARNGFRTAVLDSTTLEEANSDPINWIRQRSRWYKGYLQTFAVHSRDPRRLVAELGITGALRITTVTIAMPVASILNLISWTGVAMWFAGKPAWIASLFPASIYYVSLLLFVLGNFMAIFATVVVLHRDRREHLTPAALVIPIYWFMQSLGAIKGMYQLLARPSYWEKTTHGLSGAVPTAVKD